MIATFILDAPAMGIENNAQVGPSPLVAAFERAGQEIADFAPLFEELVPALETAEQRQFSAQGSGPIAGTWALLSAAYERIKQAKWGSQPILVASGSMREQLVGSGGGLRAITANELAFGTMEVEYASYHQHGTRRMPARPPIDLDSEFRGAFDGLCKSFARAALQKAGMDEFAEISADAAEVEGLDEALDAAMESE